MPIGKLYPGRLGAYDSGGFGRGEECKSRIGSEQKGLLAKKQNSSLWRRWARIEKFRTLFGMERTHREHWAVSLRPAAPPRVNLVKIPLMSWTFLYCLSILKKSEIRLMS